MSHQPFETWILDHPELTPSDRRALQDHLDTCQQCHHLQGRWQSVHQELRARRMAAPAPGFSQRWLSSLAERRAREQRKQAWRIFGYLLGGAFLILLLLAGYLMATSSPADWLIAVVRTVSTADELFDLGFFAVATWLSLTPLAINLALWIYLTITLCLLSFVWVLIVWRTNHIGVLNQ
jgi:anti-sigma factor RsiW